MEEHLWSQKALIANIDFIFVGSGRRLVYVFLELIRKVIISILCLFLLIEFLELLHQIFAHIPVLFFYCTRDFHSVFARDFFFTVN